MSRIKAIEIDPAIRPELRRLVVNWPRMATLSEEALYLFHMIGSGGKVLLYSPDASYLVNRSSPVPLEGWEASAVPDQYVRELQASGMLFPLSQYGYDCRIGWREMVGALGEKFDVYLCRQ